MKEIEIKCVKGGTVEMKAVPIIGEAVLDGSTEAKLKKLLNGEKPEPMTADEIKEIPSKLMR